MTDLQTTLLKLGYRNLFMRLDKHHLERLWHQPNAPHDLLTIALDADADMQARLLASEILFDKDDTFPPYDTRSDLARVYCDGLKNATAGNMWALPAHFIGVLGHHLIQFRKQAIAPLIDLLDDERVIYYEGSAEATLGNRLKIRVKDLSAFFISRIIMQPIELLNDHHTRDQLIRDLKNTLKHGEE